MKLDFIEIGPCDFDTLYEQVHRRFQKGLVVEPIPYYYNKIPKKFLRCNAAISDKDGSIKMFYVNHQDVAKFNLPTDLKGMGSISEPNPFLIDQLKDHGKPELLREINVQTMTMATLFEKFNVEEVKLLKIDAEGHDGRIVRKMIRDYKIGILRVLPKYLIHECNALMEHKERDLTHQRLIEMGYYMIQRRDNNKEYIKL